MAGGLRPSSTRRSRLSSNRGWRQDPMPDVFQIDDGGAVDGEVLHASTIEQRFLSQPWISGMMADRTAGSSAAGGAEQSQGKRGMAAGGWSVALPAAKWEFRIFYWLALPNEPQHRGQFRGVLGALLPRRLFIACQPFSAFVSPQFTSLGRTRLHPSKKLALRLLGRDVGLACSSPTRRDRIPTVQQVLSAFE